MPGRSRSEVAMVSLIVFQSYSFCLVNVYKIAPNGLGIAEGGAFEIRPPNVSTKADSSTNVQLLPSALLLQIPCACCTTKITMFINYRKFNLTFLYWIV